MLKNFFNYFDKRDTVLYSGDLYEDFINQLGGKCFGKGIFTVFLRSDIDKWEQIVSEAYQDFKGYFKILAYDWLGRCFAVDLRKETFENILMFDIGANDVLEIPCSLLNFLNEEIPFYSEECLAESFFKEWMLGYQQELSYGKCAGYKIPLFLGGEDDVSNIEECDMEVYWGVLSQIKNKI